ncbi:MAG: DoxX family protein [Flavobacteriales bacterium]
MNQKTWIYWTVTGLFAAFMMFTAIPDIILAEDAALFIGALGYPNYFIVFIGVAKALGAIAILIPGFKTIKEWAYAGFAYDLIGAVVSIISVDGLKPDIAGMLMPIGLMIGSYMLWRKRIEIKGSEA